MQETPFFFLLVLVNNCLFMNLRLLCPNKYNLLWKLELKIDFYLNLSIFVEITGFIKGSENSRFPGNELCWVIGHPIPNPLGQTSVGRLCLPIPREIGRFPYDVFFQRKPYTNTKLELQIRGTGRGSNQRQGQRKAGHSTQTLPPLSYHGSSISNYTIMKLQNYHVCTFKIFKKRLGLRLLVRDYSYPKTFFWIFVCLCLYVWPHITQKLVNGF